MPSAPDDFDLIAAGHPATPPHQLADIASRRWDLHALIASNPRSYPELRHWMATVNPASVQGPPIGVAAAPMVAAPPRRRGIGWWFAGCGCLTLIAGIVVVAAVVGGLGAMTPPDSPRRPPVQTQPDAQDPETQKHLAAFASERARYAELAARLDGNPAAPLVLIDDAFVDQLDREAAAGQVPVSLARSVAERMQGFREDLEAKVKAADARRANSSGTLTEKIVDQAGDGFIDLRWDSATACATSTACVTGKDPLVVHHKPKGYLRGEWEQRMVVTHELAHVYQFADAARSGSDVSATDRLLEKGLFQGSDEKMADCYALTYFGEDSLEHGNFTMGYGYVCNSAERQAIRDWAAQLDAPMPG
ncbi:hypothetical protein ACFWHT_06785 [Microbacterium sp. NPDC058342]|uniref:variant leucine-rich repeat-containing protein n=1 Tax=Microbacterium sp. NPDC058342 TaxID=3346454 RepID=UPI003667016C